MDVENNNSELLINVNISNKLIANVLLVLLVLLVLCNT